MTTPGLRERKKQKTKAAITEAAIDLFLSEGFEETTVVEIAEVAEVSPRTFFTYFPTKEEVVFGGLDDKLPALRERLAARPSGETAVEALRSWIVEIMGSAGWSDERELRLRTLIRETPALAAYESAHIDPRFREILAEAVAEDLGLEPSDLGPQMVAASASAALESLSEFYAASDSDHDPEELLDEAARFLAGGLDALGRPRAE